MAMMVLYGAWIMVDAAHLLSDVLGGVEDLSEDLESNVVSVEASFTYFVFLTATVLILWFITLLYGLIQWASERLAGAP